MSQSNKKVVQLSHDVTNKHPLITIRNEPSSVDSRDNLSRAEAILIFTQGFALGEEINFPARATAGLYWSLECARTILKYEASNKESIPGNPILETSSQEETIDRIHSISFLIQLMSEIKCIDNAICEGMRMVMQCVDHALEFHK